MRDREPPRLLLRADLEPVLQQDDPGLDHQLLEQRHDVQEALRRFLGAEAHHPLDAGAVVPAAIEDHDLAGGGQVRQVALRVHLRLFSRSVGAGSAITRNTRGLTRSVIALIVPPLPAPSRPSKTHAHLQSLELDPLLQLHQFDVQLLELAVVLLARQFLLLRRGSRLVGDLHDGGLRRFHALLRFRRRLHGILFLAHGCPHFTCVGHSSHRAPAVGRRQPACRE